MVLGQYAAAASSNIDDEGDSEGQLGVGDGEEHSLEHVVEQLRPLLALLLGVLFDIRAVIASIISSPSILYRQRGFRGRL